MDLLEEMLLQEEECYLQQKLYSMNMERAYLDSDSLSRYKKFKLFTHRDYFRVKALTLSLCFRVLEMWVLGQRG